ncbi:hypothetical protein AB0K09_10680 [Streptomyces sp. NPDC049577]|uniref:hypothetical protein n=1 Tax=Streptomyces sp. NPDC049577 TaxID=3155153 RepID=UPI00342952F8
MSNVRRFVAAIAATALLALGSVALATPAQAADGGGLDDVLSGLSNTLDDLLGGLGSGATGE